MPWDGFAPRVLDEALAILRGGGLLALPTDTVYGVAADPRVPGAERRICLAKGRAEDKPIPLLAADYAQIEDWPAKLNPMAHKLAQRYWPGALTMVLACGAGQWEGFRIPAHAATRTLLRAAGWPLRVTSANRSGGEPALTAQAASEALGVSVALVLDAGPAAGGRPSTVIRINDAMVTVLREGAIPGSEILAAAREITTERSAIIAPKRG